jgi:NhaA family Na+:H+ antiporter
MILKVRTKKEIVDFIAAPFSQFAQAEASGGIVLLLFAVLSIATANIPALSFIHDWWDVTFRIGTDSFYLEKSLLHWINDGLMAIFFLLVGLEIKRELLVGELSSIKNAMLPIAAAIGGMVIPASIFTLFNYNSIGESGWGIPMATDIAFAIGIVSLLGSRVSVALKIFLTAFAIVDDLGSIIVLAIFYSGTISWTMLGLAGAVVVALVTLNLIGVRRPIPYFVLGVFLWFFFLKTGIHATIAGVVLAFTIPSRGRFTQEQFVCVSNYLVDKFGSVRDGDILTNHQQQEALQSLDTAIRKMESPIHRIEHFILPWVTFFIMPLFAFANAGVSINSEMLSSLTSNISLGIFLGLVVGKPFGILLFSFVAVKMGFANLPSSTTWKQIFAIGCIGGIGFTMSIFIDSLAFTDSKLVEIGKMAILVASLAASLLGFYLLSRSCKDVQ